MALREWINKNKQATTIVSVVFLLGAISLIVYQLIPAGPETQAWYTDDDGKTWFKDSNRLVPPFERNGKQVVLAKVYECDGKEFVAWMERYRPEAARRLKQYRDAEDAGEAPNEGLLGGLGMSIEYKKPGDKDWTSELHKATEMMLVDCPDGTAAFIVQP